MQRSPDTMSSNSSSSKGRRLETRRIAWRLGLIWSLALAPLALAPNALVGQESTDAPVVKQPSDTPPVADKTPADKTPDQKPTDDKKTTDGNKPDGSKPDEKRSDDKKSDGAKSDDKQSVEEKSDDKKRDDDRPDARRDESGRRPIFPLRDESRRDDRRFRERREARRDLERGPFSSGSSRGDQPRGEEPRDLDAARGSTEPRVGVALASRGDQGLTIVDVEADGPASRAGLRRNDRLISVSGKTFARVDELQRHLRERRGAREDWLVERDGQRLTFSIEPSREPSPRLPGDRSLFSGDRSLFSGDAWLGLFTRRDSRTAGAFVSRLVPAGPAERAGVRPDDVIRRIERHDVDHPEDLAHILRDLRPGQRVELEVLRDGRPVELFVTLGNQRQYSLVRRGVEQFADMFEDDQPAPLEKMADRLERLEDRIGSLQAEIRELRETLKQR